MNRVLLHRVSGSLRIVILSMFLTGGVAFAQTTEFVATLSGSNEVPPNPSGGTGTVTATLNGTSLSISGAFGGLDSDVQTNPQGRAHIHTGMAGQNGPVTFPLNATINPDNRGGTFQSANNTFELTQEQITRLMDRGMYVNIHTMARPGGEIRGQLLPAGGAYFRANLSGRAEVSPGEPSRTAAMGSVMLELRDNQLIASGSFAGLESDLATAVGGGAHLHLASADSSGSVIFPLTVTSGESARAGTFAAASNTFTLTTNQVAALNAGRVYVNVHSMNRTGGEIRGQLVPEETIVLEAYLSAGSETDAVASDGSGVVTAILQGNTLMVSGSFQGLTSPLVPDAGGAHLHAGAPGVNGDPIFTLNAFVEPGRLEGGFRAADNTFVLEPQQRQALLNGQVYVNVHSANYTSGELRGQLLISTNLPPAASEIVTPANGTTITIPATLFGNLEARWESAIDPNNNRVQYIWEISDRPDFTGFMLSSRFTDTMASLPFILIVNLLETYGLEIGDGLTVYHRVVTTDGSLWTVSAIGSLTLRMETSGVHDEAPPVLSASTVAYPNPVTDRTTISFDLTEPSRVTLALFDGLGRSVMTIPVGMMEPGRNRGVHLDAAGLRSGVYSYRLTASTSAGEQRTGGRITVVK